MIISSKNIGNQKRPTISSAFQPNLTTKITKK